MKYYLYICCFLFSQGAFAQFVDDFSDGNFTEDPSWIGQTERFTVTNGELQLNDGNAMSSNLSYLSVLAPTSITQTTSWDFYARQEFAPAATNYGRVYLVADAPDLTGPQNGYFVRLGGASGTVDAFQFYRQDGTDEVLLFSGESGLLADDPNQIRVHIERSPDGVWLFEADYSGGEDVDPIGMVTDATYENGQYIGVWCRYTVSRADAFFFDDFRVDPLFVDTEAPLAVGLETPTNTQVRLRFSEAIAAGSVVPGAFSFASGLDISAATLDMNDPAVVILDLAEALQNNTDYVLQYDLVEDLSGNAVVAGSIPFTFVQIINPAPGDLIVTEFMADPSEPVGLPNAEYIEIYNASNAVLRLDGVFVNTGSTPQALPDFNLAPGAYATIIDADDAAEFAEFAPLLVLNSLPALANSGDVLELTNALGESLFFLEYDVTWYGDAERADGGYSLELIEIDGPYNCAGNWTASQAVRGGTPSAANSVLGQMLETTGPQLRGAFAQNPTQIILRFNENLDPDLATLAAFYTFDNGIAVSSVALIDPQTVRLTIAPGLEMGQQYTVRISANISDCLGNARGIEQSTAVGLAEAAEPGDIVINELLYYAATGGNDFIELYNRSAKNINLRDMRIVDVVNERDERINFDYLLFPGAYAVLTEDTMDINDRYVVENPNALLQTDLPTFDNREGQIALFSPTQDILDQFNYSDDLHNALLNNRRGVSLERLDPNAPTNGAGNWASAAGTQGYATPTYQNSQFRPANATPTDSPLLALENETFSPDQDGFEDVLILNYETEQAGYIADIRIFDAQGRPVRRLQRNELLAGSGRILWDGTADDGQRARLGIYIIFAELYTPTGDVVQEKLTCVLAGKLK